MEQKQLHTNFLALKFDEILLALKFDAHRFCSMRFGINFFLDHAHLTNRMQWQRKSKQHMYIDAFYTLDVFCESECSSS